MCYTVHFTTVLRCRAASWQLFVTVALFMMARGTMAFAFADGTHADCIAGGRPVIEIEAASGDPIYQLGRTAIAAPTAFGYKITWNVAKLSSLPPEVHDFIFFHECAHARVPTSDELKANCVGLKEMRAAGRAGFAVESKLAAFYRPRNSYWESTLNCASADAAAAQDRGSRS